MALNDVVGTLRRLAAWRPARRGAGPTGGIAIDDVRRLADAERAMGGAPDGCAWLDDRTVDDLDLALVFRAVDRTTTPLGAQALWRWLVAPALRLDVLAARERSLARFAARPALRDAVRRALTGPTAPDAPHLPRLLWEPAPHPVRITGFAVMLGAFVALAALAVVWWPPLAAGCVVVFVANLMLDDWANLRLAHQGRALEVLVRTLGSAAAALGIDGLRDAAVAADLAVLAPLRKRTTWLTVRDPFGLSDAVRAGLLIRVLLLGALLRKVWRERERLRRVVLWLGELDALVAIACLRGERGDARLPELSAGARPELGPLVAGGLVHPAIAGAVGNDLALAAGLLVTGSNMAGKSTFLRTVAINAICAQSIHTVFGRWRASVFRVFAAMRISDATAEGTSTYAAEVAAIGALAAAVRGDDEPPALFVIDEPFRGTNPALRVPIVVSTLDYLGARDVVIAATHDLDVAAQVDARFARGYFCEPEDGTGAFDRKLRPGVAPTSNALALLVRAGYPRALIAAVERRVRGEATT
jgi:hypothetical protein